jgi:hypothetical protein
MAEEVIDQLALNGAMPVFLLPSDFKVQCHDVRGDQLAIGFRNGRVFFATSVLSSFAYIVQYYSIWFGHKHRSQISKTNLLLECP